MYKKSNIPTYLLQMGDTFNEGFTIFPLIFTSPNQIEKKTIQSLVKLWDSGNKQPQNYIWGIEK